jgi:crossover junction endodeoxyribonuclease RusA
MIILDLPWPPTVNHMYGVMRSGRKYIKPAGVAFRKAVCEIVAELGIAPIMGRVSVVISAFPPDRRRIDLDNRIKATQDALTHAGVYLDDSQIDDLHIMRLNVEKGGKLKVFVSEIK